MWLGPCTVRAHPRCSGVNKQVNLGVYFFQNGWILVEMLGLMFRQWQTMLNKCWLNGPVPTGGTCVVGFVHSLCSSEVFGC